jgi:hypothetical protein
MIPAGSFLVGGDGALLPIHSFALGMLSAARGGIALNDGSAGINTKDWAGRVSGGEILLSAPGVAEASYTATPGAISATFAFDRNMSPSVAWNTDGDGAYFRWYDSLSASFVTTHYPDATRSMVIHDDVRDIASIRSDVLLVYQRAGGLYYRQQRDRYATEYTIRTSISGFLVSCGMGTRYRLIFRMN